MAHGKIKLYLKLPYESCCSKVASSLIKCACSFLFNRVKTSTSFEKPSFSLDIKVLRAKMLFEVYDLWRQFTIGIC